MGAKGCGYICSARPLSTKRKNNGFSPGRKGSMAVRRSRMRSEGWTGHPGQGQGQEQLLYVMRVVFSWRRAAGRPAWTSLLRCSHTKPCSGTSAWPRHWDVLLGRWGPRRRRGGGVSRLAPPAATGCRPWAYFEPSQIRGDCDGWRTRYSPSTILPPSAFARSKWVHSGCQALRSTWGTSRRRRLLRPAH